MRGGQRRGSYFFVLDAFFAATILVLTLVLLFDLVVDRDLGRQDYNYANDYLLFLTTTQIRDYQSTNITQLINDGEINNTRLTVAKQALLFHNRSRDDLARKLLNGTALILPPELSVNVTLITDERTNLLNRSLDRATNASTHLVVRTLEYVHVNESGSFTANLYGPHALEVEVWT